MSGLPPILVAVVVKVQVKSVSSGRLVRASSASWPATGSSGFSGTYSLGGRKVTPPEIVMVQLPVTPDTETAGVLVGVEK